MQDDADFRGCLTELTENCVFLKGLYILFFFFINHKRESSVSFVRKSLKSMVYKLLQSQGSVSFYQSKMY
ncbi:Uncharacterised protein [Alcaligenes faecalis]|nr:hypothetical protein CPY64_12085 [Alcaligenes faecalis]AYZ93204.1 hypothetical protein EGY22_17855 [Alcaligenes faecalis]GAU74216.1 hypothetical protein AFA2_02557 [Alcaligenes faecalis subsp. faecalis NBRC 13111]CUI97076.1 Uncharacterised protein [Alcaligenes faecalis]